jgi:hypothetical protein
MFSSHARRERCTLKTEMSVGKIFCQPTLAGRNIKYASISIRGYTGLHIDFCGLKKERRKLTPSSLVRGDTEASLIVYYLLVVYNVQV